MTKDKDRVAVYVGTYGKYNDGSIEGDWMYPGDYDSLDEFYNALHDLHKDEEDPEFMFQDTENLPDNLYSESGFSEEAFEFAKAVDEVSNPDAYRAYVDIFDNIDVSDFEDAYVGEYSSDEDFAWEMLEEFGVSNDRYFDYDHFGRELRWDLDEEEDEYYYNIEDDEELGYAWLEDMYGKNWYELEENKKLLEDYVDIRAFARDLMYDYCEQDGFYFRNF